MFNEALSTKDELPPRVSRTRNLKFISPGVSLHGLVCPSSCSLALRGFLRMIATRGLGEELFFCPERVNTSVQNYFIVAIYRVRYFSSLIICV